MGFFNEMNAEDECMMAGSGTTPRNDSWEDSLGQLMTEAVTESGDCEEEDLDFDEILEENPTNEPPIVPADEPVVKKQENTKAKHLGKESAVKSVPSNQRESSSIDKGVSITGDIVCLKEGDFQVAGAITGNMNVKGHVVILPGAEITGNITAEMTEVRGEVTGDIHSSAGVLVSKTKVLGDICSSEFVEIEEGTVVIGDITAKSLMISGAIKGDIDVAGEVSLTSTAVVKGNIKSSSITMALGAVIDGVCSQCYGNENAFSLFGEIKG